MLSEASRRVRTAMRLHQRLQEGDGESVRLDDLLSDVCGDVADLDAGERQARLRIDLHPVTADARTASALAIITAEWVGNALEHGLAGRAGTVSVTLEAVGVGNRLSVADDGLGSGRGEWRPGFGASLVARLARQLGGEVVRSATPAGSRLELTWPSA